MPSAGCKRFKHWAYNRPAPSNTSFEGVKQMTLTIPFSGTIKPDSRQKISDAIMGLSGIECVVVNQTEKEAVVTGGDLDYLSICDAIESLGFTILR